MLIATQALGTEVARQSRVATEAQRAALLHLQAWLDYAIADWVYEANFDRLQAFPARRRRYQIRWTLQRGLRKGNLRRTSEDGQDHAT